MKNFVSNIWKSLKTVFLITSLLALTACSTGANSFANASQKIVSYHFFSYDGIYDTPESAKQVDLLEYSYGDELRKTHDLVKYGKESLPSGAGFGVNMPAGEFLYVKWRIKATGEEVEYKVDLRDLIPKNMFDLRITFVIDGKQLYVYLVTRLAKPKDAPILKTSWSRNNLTYEIYPNNTYKK